MKTKNDPKEESLKPFIILLIIVFAIWELFNIGTILTFRNWETRAQFGDMFGAINSLFSGLAFAGIIYTIFLQRKELSLQRLELIETRKELARTASAQEHSESALREQAENFNISAQLTALNTLVVYYNDLQNSLAAIGSPQTGNTYKKKEQYLSQIESILESQLNSPWNKFRHLGHY